MAETETTNPAVRPGMDQLVASLATKRWGYALILSLAFAAIVAMGSYGYRTIDLELTAAALSRREAVTQLAAATLSEKFARLVDITVSLATRVRFRELVAEAKWAEASEILRAVPRDFPFVERLFLTDVEGTLMADVPQLPGVRGVNFSGRDWYIGVRRNWTPYVSQVYKRSAPPQIDVFAVAAPIRNASGGVAGILVLQVRIESLLEWIREIEIGREGFVFVMDSNGQVAFHSKFPDEQKRLDYSQTPIVQKLRRGEHGIATVFDPFEREESVSAYAPVMPYGWGVVAQQPARTAFATKHEQLARLSTAYGLTLLFFVSGTYLAWRIILQRRQAGEDRWIKTELERRVEERTSQLEAANKELESFSYSVSHDLRSPLRAIDGFSRILLEDYGDKLDDEGRRLFGVIRQNSQKMGQLIDNLLEFSRLGRKPLSAAKINTKRLVEEVLGELRAGSEWRAGLTLGALPPAYGDAVLVKQAWANLLGNAVKFSSKREQPVIEVSGSENGTENVYCVKDNGAGFDMRYYSKLFGVFQRLHGAQEFEGTGVGLAIVQRVVSRHGGRVWADGRVDGGAAFYFSLPKEQHDGRV